MKKTLLLCVFRMLFAIIFFAPSQKAVAEEIRVSSFAQIAADPAYFTQHHLSDLHKLFPPVERRKKVLCVVIDSGVQASHPIFEGSIRQDLARDFLVGFGQLQPEVDWGPHGTLVASIMLAASGRACDIVSLKAALMLDNQWWGGAFVLTAALREINSWDAKTFGGYAGIVVNASVLIDEKSEDLNALRALRAEIEKLGARAVIVGAAGNQGLNPIQYPAYWAGSIRAMTSVGATDADGKKAPFSNYGTEMLNTALGVDVPGAIPNGYGLGYGTSFAAPIISGEVAALMVLAADKGFALPPALFARVANIGDYNPNLAGMMAYPPTSANGLKAWEALDKLLGLKPLRADFDRSGQVPLVSILVQEPLNQFTGLKFTARIETAGRQAITSSYYWFSGTTINFMVPDQKPGDYRVTVMAEKHELFTVSLTVPDIRTADDPNPRHSSGEGGGR